MLSWCAYSNMYMCVFIIIIIIIIRTQASCTNQNSNSSPVDLNSNTLTNEPHHLPKARWVARFQTNSTKVQNWWNVVYPLTPRVKLNMIQSFHLPRIGYTKISLCGVYRTKHGKTWQKLLLFSYVECGDEDKIHSNYQTQCLVLTLLKTFILTRNNQRQ